MGKKPILKTSESRKAKKEAPKREPPKPETARASSQDVARQQIILNVFQDAFSELLSSNEHNTTLQEVKQALFNRDFETAFGREEYLEVYAARWSPTRALCYESVLQNIKPHLKPLFRPSPSEEGASASASASAGPDATGSSTPAVRVVSIGGGAAEIVAFGGFLGRPGDDNPDLRGNIHLVDSGPWGGVVEKLRAGLTVPPRLSKYAGAAARAANAALVDEERVSATFARGDVLSLGKAGLAGHVGEVPVLATLLFTLNELFTSGGIAKTTAFLLDLTCVLPVGSLLLVVDSPGSYSETVVGKQARKYPMQWLLDKILLATESEPVEGRRWTKLESVDSVWFRLAGALDYPIPLEDMRYQMHLYRVDRANAKDDISAKSTG